MQMIRAIASHYVNYFAMISYNYNNITYLLTLLWNSLAAEVITIQNTSRSHARVFENTMVIFYCVHLPHYITT